MARERRAAAYRRLAWTAAGATLGLIVLGGVVRISGSGMACGDDWPLCKGELLPPLDLPTLIEYGHRLAASLVGLLVGALAALAWIRHRGDRELRRPATFAAGLLVGQVLLGAVTVRLGLPAASVVLHLALAMLLLATLVAAALRAHSGAGAEIPAAGDEASTGEASLSSPPRPGYGTLARVAAALGFAVVVLGGLVANLGAGPACRGFPLCNGTLLPAGGTLAAVQWVHRLLAFVLVVLLAASFGWSRVPGAASRGVRRLAAAAFALALAQVGVAAAMVLRSLPGGLRAAHLAIGALLWSCLVALDQFARRSRHAKAERPAFVPAAAALEAPLGDGGALRRPGRRVAETR